MYLLCRVSLIFGVITCFAGFFGVGIGTFMAGQLRYKVKNADPIVCAVGLIAAAPFFYFTLVVSQYNTAITWVTIILECVTLETWFLYSCVSCI